jgi:hypothetical protein
MIQPNEIANKNRLTKKGMERQCQITPIVSNLLCNGVFNGAKLTNDFFLCVFGLVLDLVLDRELLLESFSDGVSCEPCLLRNCCFLSSDVVLLSGDELCDMVIVSNNS